MRPQHMQTKEYKEGYRNGRLDKLLGIRLITALTSHYGNGDYALGYLDGQML